VATDKSTYRKCPMVWSTITKDFDLKWFQVAARVWPAAEGTGRRTKDSLRGPGTGNDRLASDSGTTHRPYRCSFGLCVSWSCGGLWGSFLCLWLFSVLACGWFCWCWVRCRCCVVSFDTLGLFRFYPRVSMSLQSHYSALHFLNLEIVDE